MSNDPKGDVYLDNGSVFDVVEKHVSTADEDYELEMYQRFGQAWEGLIPRLLSVSHYENTMYLNDVGSCVPFERGWSSCELTQVAQRLAQLHKAHLNKPIDVNELYDGLDHRTMIRHLNERLSDAQLLRQIVRVLPGCCERLKSEPRLLTVIHGYCWAGNVAWISPDHDEPPTFLDLQRVSFGCALQDLAFAMIGSTEPGNRNEVNVMREYLEVLSVSIPYATVWQLWQDAKLWATANALLGILHVGHPQYSRLSMSVFSTKTKMLPLLRAGSVYDTVYVLEGVTEGLPLLRLAQRERRVFVESQSVAVTGKRGYRCVNKINSHRKKTNYKPPRVKQKLASIAKTAQVAVIIMAGDSGGARFPQSSAWSHWSSSRVGFSVFVDDVDALRNDSSVDWSFWEPFVCPHRNCSAWGEMSLLRAQLVCLRWAVKMYPNAQWFYFTSGDSVPVKNADYFCEGPLDSMLGLCDELMHQNWHETPVSEHSQWIVLTAEHARLVAMELAPGSRVFTRWEELHSQFKMSMCCFSAPDEWVIGTFLLANVKGEWYKTHLNQCAVEQEFVQGQRECCGRLTGHAVVLSDYPVLLEKHLCAARKDPYTFALRKIK